eukprot:CAMPEP_0182485426 /NCGR_PEP_ID=MMETSP1319-20130603/45220_1 /TAXON_ID=172717 /ORGANISM="Bolidomonas pacifica, Strain RCC208" /LENGTH=56 /DNA_ID=CAMNT_0024687405 /DNA_START=590 /DNA_END=757 /DNA_ORIENTATION=+
MGSATARAAHLKAWPSPLFDATMKSDKKRPGRAPRAVTLTSIPSPRNSPEARNFRA